MDILHSHYNRDLINLKTRETSLDGNSSNFQKDFNECLIASLLPGTSAVLRNPQATFQCQCPSVSPWCRADKEREGLSETDIFAEDDQMIGKFFELQVAQEILNAVRRCEERRQKTFSLL